MPGYGYIRERRKPAGPSAKPQITSFADVTLVLLVIFLVSAAAAVQMVAADLPTAVNTASRDINLAVTVSLSNQPPPVAKKDGEKATPAPAPEKKTDEKDKAKKAPWLFYFEDDTTGIEAKNLWAVLKATNGERAWPLLRGEVDTVRDAAPVEYTRGPGGMRLKTVVTTDRRLTWYAGESYGELYDLAAGPAEKVNQWENPAYAGDREELLGHLIDQFAPLGRRAPMLVHGA